MKNVIRIIREERYVFAEIIMRYDNGEIMISYFDERRNPVFEITDLKSEKKTKEKI